MSTSNGIEPGQKAPLFELPNANSDLGSGNLSLSTTMGNNGLIIAFTCNHCPYVVGSESRIEKMALKAKENGIGFVGINSNDPVNYESDSWLNMVKRASKGMLRYMVQNELQNSISLIPQVLLFIEVV
jgi:hypothetical protein